MRMTRPLAALAVTLALCTGAEGQVRHQQDESHPEAHAPAGDRPPGDTVTVEVSGRARAITDRQL